MQVKKIVVLGVWCIMYAVSMANAQIITVAPGSPAAKAGLQQGDEIVAVNGESPSDVIRWHMLVDSDEVNIEIRRNAGASPVACSLPNGAADSSPVAAAALPVVNKKLVINKNLSEPLGVELNSAVFNKVTTCDNHCEFCFIHQLPRGMRRSLYLKDDDYRLSFLYGNFTTLTRFTELDYERVVTECLSPLYVSIHATDPDVRAAILQNRRGAMSLRWLRMLLNAGIEVHGQVVLCPGVNDGDILVDTLIGVLDRFSELRTLCVVPLGLSKFNRQARMRLHTQSEACAVLDTVHRWQQIFLDNLGRRLVYAADEYYIMCGRDFPPVDHYDGVDMQEDGIGMARTFEREFTEVRSETTTPRSGFFSWVDGAPADGYRAPTQSKFSTQAVNVRSNRCISNGDTSNRQPVALLTGVLGAHVIEPLVMSIRRDGVRVLPVENRFFGGNIGVTGLMTGSDLVRVLTDEPDGYRYLLPDVCLSRGQFLDGMSPADLPKPVEIIPTHGRALRDALTK